MEIERLLDDKYLLSLIIISIIITYGFRLAGYLFSIKIDQKSEWMRLVSSIATAFVAAMVTHIIIFPAGSLINTDITSRVGALFIGVICFMIAKNNLAVGVVASVLSLVALEYITKNYY